MDNNYRFFPQNNGYDIDVLDHMYNNNNPFFPHITGYNIYKRDHMYNASDEQAQASWRALPLNVKDQWGKKAEDMVLGLRHDMAVAYSEV
jgi:hypothetical protein